MGQSAEGTAQRAWGKGHGAKGKARRAWGTGHSAKGLGHREQGTRQGDLDQAMKHATVDAMRYAPCPLRSALCSLRHA